MTSPRSRPSVRARRRRTLHVEPLEARNLFDCALRAGLELTEGNAECWGTFASDGRPASVSNDATRVKSGTASLRFDTQSGFDTGVKFPAQPGRAYNLSKANFLVYWAYAVNTNIGFQGNQPVIVLHSPTGTIRLEPRSLLMYNRAWHYYHIPLAGDQDWIRTTTGTPSLSAITQFEIHQDTWDLGFTIYYDSLRFTQLNPGGLPPAGPPPPKGVNPNALEPKVLLYVFDPIMTNYGNVPMHEAYRWGDPEQLTEQIVSDMRTSSHDLLRYNVVETVISRDWPIHTDGFQYDPKTYDFDWQRRQWHTEGFDYRRFLLDQGIAPRIDSGELDEVWLYAFPGAGMWESTMAGNGGYWCNSSPVQGVPSERTFVVMGWNFERGVAEAIHSFGHRAESIMVHSYGPWQANENTTWNKFTLLERNIPGRGGVGNVHFPVNGVSDYDYANTRFVTSNADDWYNYPDFTGTTRSINFREWSPDGRDPHRQYLNWWYDHMPHMPGRGRDHFLANWWRYIADPDQFKGWNGNLYYSEGIPSVRTISPQTGETVSGVVTVRADATVDGALGRVDLYIDGVYHSTDTMAPYTFIWDTAGYEGPRTLVAKAYELQNGTEGVAAEVVVTVEGGGFAPGGRAGRLDWDMLTELVVEPVLPRAVPFDVPVLVWTESARAEVWMPLLPRADEPDETHAAPGVIVKGAPDLDAKSEVDVVL